MTNSTIRTPEVQEVEMAASRIVDAFSNTDTERYFAGFAEAASFIFHPEPARLQTRIEYEALWQSWLEDGWEVVSCVSSDHLIQVFAGGAVFSHSVQTVTKTGGTTESYRERESIVFQLIDNQLLAIHEHLSPFEPDQLTESN